MEGGSAKRVLVVGDRPEVAAVVGDLLTRYGYQVRQATCRAAASVVLEAEEGTRPDLAILDAARFAHATFPVMQSLRNSAPSALPVIVLTTRAAEDLEGEFHRAGASRLLWKPVSAAELLAAVAEVVN